MLSIVTPNRNRQEHLRRVLPSWQNCPHVADIVVVDYGSREPIRPNDFSSDDKLTIVRVEGAEHWRIGHAANIGFDYAARPHVWKVDSDTEIADGTWLETVRPNGCFYRGHFQAAVPNGLVLLAKDDWRAVGGYHEWLSGYGYDDSDFYFRLRQAGVAEDSIPSAAVRAIEHGDDVRSDYAVAHTMIHLESNARHAKIRYDSFKNTFLALMLPWKAEYRTPYEELSREGRVVTVRTADPSPAYYPQDIMSQFLAATCMFSDPTTKQAANQIALKLVDWAGSLQPVKPKT